MKTVQKLLCMQTWVYNHEWSQRIVLNENNAFTVVSKDASLSEVRHTSHTNLWLNKGEWKTERILKNMDLFRLKEGRTLSTLCVFGLRVAESHHLLFYTVFDIEQPPFAHLGAIVAVRCSDGPLHNSAGQKKKKTSLRTKNSIAINKVPLRDRSLHCAVNSLWISAFLSDVCTCEALSDKLLFSARGRVSHYHFVPSSHTHLLKLFMPCTPPPSNNLLHPPLLL